MNIPIYRAKKIDSDVYVEGYYFHQETTKDYENDESEEREEVIEHYIFSYSHHDVNEHEEGYFEFQRLNQIDLSTLAIHFSDMLDGQGNKFFASLSENGIGGDVFITENEDEQYDTWRSTDYGTTTAIFNSNGVGFTCWEMVENGNDSIYSREHTKITGIKKEE